jgi:trehalose 6-phosphate synthase/phosphatase
MGDDITDEDMFQVFIKNINAFTVKIGPGSTYAKYKLSGIQQAILLLKQLLAGMS